MNLRRVAVLAILLMLALPVFGQAEDFLPDDLTPIKVENAGELSLLARIGRGLVYDIQWAEDGESLFVSASTGVWEYPADEGAAMPDAPILAHDAAFVPGILSVNGEYLAERNDVGTVRVSDLTGDTVTEFETNTPFLRLAFSGDGQTLAAADSGGTAYIWSLTDGNAHELIAVSASPYVISLNNDGSLLAVAASEQTEDLHYYDVITVYDTATGEDILIIDDPAIWLVNDFQFSADNTQLTAAARNAVYVWDIETGVLLQTFNNPGVAVEGSFPTRLNESVDITPDQRIVAVIGEDWILGVDSVGAVYLWDAITGEEIAVLDGMTGYSTLIAFSPDGTQLAYYAYDGGIRVWNVGSTEQPRIVSDSHYGSNDTLAISPDATELLVGGFERTLRRYSLVDGTVLENWQDHRAAIEAVAYSPDGTLFVSASRLEVILRCRGETFILDVPAADMLALAFSPDDSMVYGASTLATSLYSWQAPIDGTDVQRADLTLTEGVTAGAFNPDVSLLAIGGDSGRVTLYDPVTLEEQAVLEQTGGVTALAFSPDGTLLASAHNGDTIALWEIVAGETKSMITHDGRMIYDLTFNPAGTLLTGAAGDGSVRLWSVETGEQIAVYTGHLSAVTSVAFSADGTLLLSGSWDSTIQIWGTP